MGKSKGVFDWRDFSRNGGGSNGKVNSDLLANRYKSHLYWAEDV